MKHINIILFRHFYFFQNGLIDLWTPKGCHFIKNINAFLHKILSLGFQNSISIFLRVPFLVATLFYTYEYLFELIFGLLTFEDKRVRVLPKTFLRSNIVWCAQDFPGAHDSIFYQWKTSHLSCESWNLAILV